MVHFPNIENHSKINRIQSIVWKQVCFMTQNSNCFFLSKICYCAVNLVEISVETCWIYWTISWTIKASHQIFCLYQRMQFFDFFGIDNLAIPVHNISEGGPHSFEKGEEICWMLLFLHFPLLKSYLFKSCHRHHEFLIYVFPANI